MTATITIREDTMKRSEINRIIIQAKEFFRSMGFHLPPWAFWAPEEWKGRYEDCSEIVDNMLGWDVTPFGGTDFKKRGLLLFTLRNGNPRTEEKPYAEKIMIVEENQETPMHFHWSKMEDIINRGGGNLVIELFASKADETFSNEPFTVSIDGIKKKLTPGSTVILKPGESICLTPRLYHRFYGEPGKGKVLIGEVSKVNDDTADNRFAETLGRFPGIDEDEKPIHLLAIDYKNYI